MSADVSVRPATIDELPDVLNVLDAAMLDTDTGRLRSAVDREEVLVAVAARERVLGALVLDETEVTAVAVRPRRRGQGIGTALVEAAAARRSRLVAEFDADVTAFWKSVGFEYRPVAATTDRPRFRGVREPTP